MWPIEVSPYGDSVYFNPLPTFRGNTMHVFILEYPTYVDLVHSDLGPAPMLWSTESTRNIACMF